jgi:hypothetical protein
MKDSRLYLIHVRDCLARIKSYTQGGKVASKVIKSFLKFRFY